MVDSKFEKHENFVINDKYDDEEVPELNREDYYDDHTNIFNKKNLNPFILGGIGLIVIVVLLVIFLSGPDNDAENMQLISLEAKIQQLEKKLASFGSVDQALDRVGKLEQKVNLISEKFESSNSAVTTQIDQIIKELGALHQTSSQPPQPIETDRKETKPKIHQVRPKETLWGISRQYDLTVDQLRKYNNMGSKATIQPGQELKLTPN